MGPPLPAWLLLALVARGQTPDNALLGEALDAARRGDPAAEHLACAQIVAAGPHDRCARRLAWLDARRDGEGSLTLLARLEQVRLRWRDQPPEVSRAEVEAVFDQAPPGALRADAGIWLARDALGRLNDPDLTLTHTRPLLDVDLAQGAPLDPTERDRLRRQAVGLHSRALAKLNRTEEAVRVEAEIRVPSQAPRLSPVEQIARERRLGQVASLAWGAVGTFLLVALPVAVRARRIPQGLPLGLIPLWIGCGGTWFLAESWAAGAGAALPWMTGGLTAIHLVSFAALSRPRVGAPVIRLLSALASLAVVFLALYRTQTLAWVGL